MHHTINPAVIKQQRDEFFAAYWTAEISGINESPYCKQLEEAFREVAEHAFAKGFFHGLCVGVEHGGKAASVAIANDVADIVGIDL